MKENLKVLFADNNQDSSIVDLLKGVAKEIQVLDLYDLKDEPELVIFTGGEDVDPSLYMENAGKFTSFNKKRDKLEASTYNDFRYIPKLGICRGAQFLTVMNHGKLVQHVTGHTSDHTIETDCDRVMNVTSTHHQMMYPFGLKADSYKLIAWAQYFKSNTYLNGNNVEIPPTREFLEPEIVYYPNTSSLAIQGHPEYSHAEKIFKDYTIGLIEYYLFNQKSKSTISYGTSLISESSAPTWRSWGDSIITPEDVRKWSTIPAQSARRSATIVMPSYTTASKDNSIRIGSEFTIRDTTVDTSSKDSRFNTGYGNFTADDMLAALESIKSPKKDNDIKF